MIGFVFLFCLLFRWGMATHSSKYSCLENSMDGGYSPWGCKESDTTEQLHFSFFSSFIWTSVFLVCSFICAVFLCLFFFKVFFSQASRKIDFFPWKMLNSFFLFVSALLRLVQWFVWASYRVRFVLSFCLFVFPLMGKAEWGCTPVCWWLGLYFCFVCCVDEASCTGCYWRLGDAGSCIQGASFVWVLTIWYSLG